MDNYSVEFRCFSKYDDHTPLMHIPKERTNLSAESISDARTKFYHLDMIVNTVKNGGHCVIIDVFKVESSDE